MTSEETEKAKLIVAEWFWQPAEGHNYRYRGANRTITRFYEAASMEPDVVRLVVEYLRDQQIEGEISLLNRKIDLGTGWKSMDVWYQTSAGEKWDGTESTKIRIYQTIMQSPTSDDAKDGPYTVENGCQYLVTHEFHWNVAAIPTLPASSSGVNYTLQGVTRDRETGLYSCVIERRERVQQDVALYDSARTFFEKRQDEQHIGVKAENVGGTGLAASAGGGTMVRRQVSKNADCTSDVRNEVVIEQPVGSATVQYRRNLRGTTTSVTHRNQPTALDGDGMAAGETRKTEITDGGLHDNTTESTAAANGTVAVGKSCQKQTSVHTDTTVESIAAANVPASIENMTQVETNKEKEVSFMRNEDGVTAEKRTVTRVYSLKTGSGSTNSGNGVVTTTVERKENATAAPNTTGVGVNKVVEIDSQPNDHGSLTTVKRVTTYTKLEGSATRDSGNGVVTVSTERKENETTVPKASDYVGVNKIVEIEVQPNDHGSKTTVKRITAFSEQTGQGATNSGNGVVTTSVERKENTTTWPTTSGAAVNKVVEIDAQPNDHGSLTTVKRVTTYAEKTGGGSTNSGNGIVTTSTERKENATADPDTSGAGVNKLVEVEIQPNDHGSKTTVRRVTTYAETVTKATTNFATEKIVTTTTKHDATTTVAATLGEAHASPDDAGAATTTVSEYTPKKVDSKWLTWNSQTVTARGTYWYAHGVRIFKNVTSQDLASIKSGISGSNVSIDVSVNRFGLFDGKIAYSNLTSWQESGSGGGVYGGVSTGTITFLQYMKDNVGRSLKRTIAIPVKYFYGKGNEGSEGSVVANQTFIAGCHLPGRTYATGAPTIGQWQQDNG